MNDHNKDANENDQEMKKLFEDLCGQNEFLNQKILVEQFEKYGIEINSNEFFRLVKGKELLFYILRIFVYYLKAKYNKICLKNIWKWIF